LKIDQKTHRSIHTPFLAKLFYRNFSEKFYD
jgi:hypothetical protein